MFLLKVFPGLDPRAVLPVLDSVRGLVVEAHGSGGTNPATERPFCCSRCSAKRARQKGLPVVVISQAPRNGVDLSLYEAGRAALDEGAISGSDMTSSAAVVKLMHALARCRERLKTLRSYMSREHSRRDPGIER